MKTDTKEYHYNVDFLRFVLAIMIIYYHLLPIICTNFPTNEILNFLSERATLIGRNAVDAFFIISGYFLFKTSAKKSVTTYDFLVNRIFRLWPVMAFSFLILLINGKFNLYTDLLNLFFINSGLGVIVKPSSNSATWFICVLFFLSIFFHYLINNFKEKNLACICSFLCFLGFSILSHAKGNHYATIVLPSLQLTAGMVTGISCMSLGIISAILFEKFKMININKNIITYIFTGLIECFLFIYFIYSSIYYKPRFNMFVYWQIIFIILFLLFILKIGFLSKILNNKFSKYLGDFSYSIFVMHLPIITICKKYFWAELAPGASAILTFSICVIAGILTHIFIEKKQIRFMEMLKSGKRGGDSI